MYQHEGRVRSEQNKNPIYIDHWTILSSRVLWLQRQRNTNEGVRPGSSWRPQQRTASNKEGVIHAPPDVQVQSPLQLITLTTSSKTRLMPLFCTRTNKHFTYLYLRQRQALKPKQSAGNVSLTLARIPLRRDMLMQLRGWYSGCDAQCCQIFYCSFPFPHITPSMKGWGRKIRWCLGNFLYWTVTNISFFILSFPLRLE